MYPPPKFASIEYKIEQPVKLRFILQLASLTKTAIGKLNFFIFCFHIYKDEGQETTHVKRRFKVSLTPIPLFHWIPQKKNVCFCTNLNTIPGRPRNMHIFHIHLKQISFPKSIPVNTRSHNRDMQLLLISQNWFCRGKKLKTQTPEPIDLLHATLQHSILIVLKRRILGNSGS